MNKLVTTLKNFGMSEKEAKIYLTLLELGSAKVSEVAKSSGINRSSAYVVLETLKKRGLVGISDDKNIRRYVAASPEVILQTAESSARQQEGVKEDIKASIPELRALSKKTKNYPVVQVFEGKEGLIHCFEDSLNSKEKFMRVASAPANLGKVIYDYLPLYVKKRARLGIKMKSIHPGDKKHIDLIKKAGYKYDSYLVIPKREFKLQADFAVYDDKIGYMSTSHGGFGILIQDKELSEVMKSIFDLAWEEAKRLNKKKGKEKKRAS